jgi:hypothetical protein
MKLRMAGGLCLWLMAGFALADEIELKPGHPERYTVVRGDTLWDIAGKFLSRPWQWPEIWHDNRQIANPHWIYPGDELVLSVVDGKPSLQVGYRSGGEGAGAAEASGGDVRLSPVVRVEPLGQAIPTIPLSAIQQFLTEPKVALDPAQMESAPYVVAMADEHVVVGSGDRVYVRGLADRRLGVGYMVFRPGQPYTDAETGDILGYEALYVGNADVQAVDELATLRVTKSAREVVIGDRILPVDYEKVQTRYQPHPPALPVWGHVISVVDGVSQIGQWNIVVIDRGTADGIETGAVLEVRQGGASQRDIMSPSANEVITLPAEKEGLLMVFRPFERVSFALVMNAVRAIHLNDTVTNP